MNDDEIDEEFCTLHQQDGNECEALDNAGNTQFKGCRRWRYDMYIRGEIAPTIADAARLHFNAQNN